MKGQNSRKNSASQTCKLAGTPTYPLHFLKNGSTPQKTAQPQCNMRALLERKKKKRKKKVLRGEVSKRSTSPKDTQGSKHQPNNRNAETLSFTYFSSFFFFHHLTNEERKHQFDSFNQLGPSRKKKKKAPKRKKKRPDHHFNAKPNRLHFLFCVFDSINRLKTHSVTLKKNKTETKHLLTKHSTSNRQ